MWWQNEERGSTRFLASEAVLFGGWLIRYWMFAISFTLLNGHVGAMCHTHTFEVNYKKYEHQLRVWFKIFCRILFQKIQCTGSHKILSTVCLSQALSWCKGKEKSHHNLDKVGLCFPWQSLVFDCTCFTFAIHDPEPWKSVHDTATGPKIPSLKAVSTKTKKDLKPPKTTYNHLQPSTITSATRKLSKTI